MSNYLKKMDGHVALEKDASEHYTAYAILYNPGTGNTLANRCGGYIDAKYLYKKGGISRDLEYHPEDEQVIYITDLTPNYDKEQFFLDLHTRLYRYHKWASDMGFNISDKYTYEEAQSTKAEQFLTHVGVWTARVSLFDDLLKGAYKQVLGFID